MDRKSRSRPRHGDADWPQALGPLAGIDQSVFAIKLPRGAAGMGGVFVREIVQQLASAIVATVGAKGAPHLVDPMDGVPVRGDIHRALDQGPDELVPVVGV